ncbi:MAG: dockerin type I domain-containing protein [Candidatus Omnitrophota bacterium]
MEEGGGGLSQGFCKFLCNIQACVNHILGTQDWGAAADVNSDGAVNVLDVQEIVNIILGA